MPVRYLFAGPNDWANVCNRVARAINTTAGERVACVFSQPHPFHYPQDHEITRLSEHQMMGTLMEAAKTARWFISADDSDGYEFFTKLLSKVPLPKRARLATVHTGSSYRDNHEEFDRRDRAMRFHTRIIGGDLFRFAENDDRAVPFFAPPHADPPAGLRARIAAEPISTPIICHAPSIKAVKGTKDIMAALRNYDVDLIHGVSFNECIERRARAHIFVDQLNGLGGFGAAAVEAMATGCAVIGSTANIVKRVDAFYERPPIVTVDGPETLSAAVYQLVNEPNMLRQLRLASIEWAARTATQKAIADYWMKKVLPT